ncbi:MAG: two-component system, OmpR family, alkaline phosphatase synthesis response regulator PhoP [Pyrinomonadaceae bacterium]|jgi:two-component system chemotaxis response regulator CheY|nr:two-component system, OmpR family, alkaline phosphatase synthesis response regulator PhoP [Pyrinomonadaceae bacterium]
MTLTKDLFHKIADPNLTHDERAWQRCKLAKQLERLGNYDGAREAMGELWQGIGEQPMLEGLASQTTAEVLLRIGALTGWIGSTKQLEGAQKKAKDIISESLRIFEASESGEKIAEAQTEIAYCCWREGAFDEARTRLHASINLLNDPDTKVSPNNEVRALTLLRSAIVEQSIQRYNDALRICMEAAPIFEKCGDLVLQGNFHNEFANVLNYLSSTEYREDYVDRALIEYAAASYHFEQAGHSRYQACVENNLGFLYGTIGRFAEAHEHLDRAQALFTSLKDSVHLAQVDDARAKVLLEQRKDGEAEKLVRGAVRVLERGGEQSLYAEALTTHGIALARLGKPKSAQDELELASKVAEEAGDLESAGQAALTLIEEVGSHLSESELSEIYVRAAELLEKSQNMATLKRLCECARRVLFLTHAAAAPPDWKGFSFREAVRRYESHLIERALRDADGMVSRAAQWLGFKHHHSLVSLLKNRHKHLLHARTPIVPRRRSIIRPATAATTPAPYHGARQQRPAEKAARPALILHVEDNRAVAVAVRDTLEEQGWAVRHCADGAQARREIASDAHYDLILLDNELPGANGVELVRRARSLPRRRQTPIIMFAASDCEADARRAGADAFLHKPKDIALLVETVARLLADKPAGR